MLKYKLISLIFPLFLSHVVAFENVKATHIPEPSYCCDSILAKRFTNSGLAFNEALRFLENAIENQNLAHIAEAHNMIAVLLQDRGLYAQSLENYLVSLDYYLEVPDYLKIGWHYVEIGNIYFHNDLYQRAEEYYELGRQAFIQLKDPDAESVAINNLGLIAGEQGNYPLALKYFEQALSLRQKSRRCLFNILHSYQYLGNTYNDMGDTSKATWYFKKIIDSDECMEEYNFRGKIHHYLGDVYLQQNKTRQAIKEFEQARTNFTKVFNAGLLCELYVSMSEAEQKNRDEKKAIAWLLKADSLSSAGELFSMRLTALGKIISFYKSKDDFQHVILYDSIRNNVHNFFTKKEMQKALLNMQSMIELSQTKKVIEKNEATLRKNILIRNFVIMAGLILTAFFIYVYYSLSRRRKKDGIIQRQKAELLKQEINIRQIKHQENLLLLQTREKELACGAMHMARLNELSFTVSKELKSISMHVSIENRRKIQELISQLNIAAPITAWKEFETRFENVHQDFYRSLRELHPELSPNEIKICSFIRLNLPTKDIAIVTNRSIRTIESTRSSIRKKLNLPTDTSLTGYLLSI